MKQCVICKKDIRMLASKIYNGYICKECRRYIPSSIQLSATDADYLLRLYNRNSEKSRKFEYTASYGSMYIDSVHSMLCFSTSSDKNGPVNFGDIFTVDEIREMSLYCTDVRNVGTNSNKIVCNVKMKIKTDDVSVEYMVCRNQSCSYSVSGNNKLECREPDKLVMFRCMVNQMIDDTLSGLQKKLDDINYLKKVTSESEKEKEWARGILFLENIDCTQEEIKKQQRVMMRIFHPDIHPEYDADFAGKINKAYEILSKK